MKKSIEEIRADYHLFIDIQMGKYFKGKGKTEFSSDEEAKWILDKIVRAYNQKIASDHLHLDNLNEAAKASWFNSVEIDFEKPHNSHLPFENIPGIKKETREFISFYDDLLPFLPEAAIVYLMNAGPAFEAYGYSFERFEKIIDGEDPTEIEEDLLLWAYDIALSVAQAYLEKDKAKKEKFLSIAIAIANEELDEKTSVDVVAEIYANYKEIFSEHKKKKQKSEKQRQKKKK
jgi:hypothetical protein